MEFDGVEMHDDSDDESSPPSTSVLQPKQLGKEEFLENIKQFSKKTCRSFDADEHWIVEKRHGVTHMKNEAIVEGTKSGQALERYISVTYSENYRVPIFWFAFKERDSGRYLSIQDLEKTVDCAAFNWNAAVKNGMSTSLSEHPATGNCLFQCHACETPTLMAFAKNSQNYVFSWLSYMCSQFEIPFKHEWGQ
ncbi:hypothetical protein L596_021592 [Steinernema carpocapsae]|uniref:Ubiquitin-like-conjugating enzyme ATG10 n=1 Tax=Steinernema carpocapsae TaxID=34508 RepID=A0A4U5MJ71_STECR|nr:hypothetical protein L596_021592 [Steinernema carpocapsae]